MRSALGRIFGALAAALAVAAPIAARDLSFEDRVAAQKAIEQVYWNHRIWPEANLQRKPPLMAVMSDDVIRAKVEDYLKESNALENRWHRPITSKDLQAEVDRMTRETRAPEVLRELYAALGNDPTLIAETLARPILVDRLVRELYAGDDRFHGSLRRDAERALASARGVSATEWPGARYVERRILRGKDRRGDPAASREHDVALSAEEWEDWARRLARRFGSVSGRPPIRQVSALQEGPDRFFVTTVLSLEAGTAVVASSIWPKRSFDEWWSGERAGMATELVPPVASYTVAAPTVSACTNDTWASGAGFPPGRYEHTAIWTGAEMIVWGGSDDITAYNTGSRYNPSTNSWTPTSTGANVPDARNYHSAVWTGVEMIVWGGEGYNTGGRYDPTTDSWRATSIGTNVPQWRYYHTALWTGTEMIVWGGIGIGFDYLNKGARYNPAMDSWTPTSLGANLPQGRYWHTAVWTGTEMIVWGGRFYVSDLNTGGRYNPSTDVWTATSAGVGTPVARIHHSAVWAGNRMVIWGGESDNNVPLNTGSRYTPSTNSWLATSTGANVPAGRIYHTAVWTGTEMLVWGGRLNSGSDVNTGGRYSPSSNGWVATSSAAVPSGRSFHSAVWTGTQMIIWGGSSLVGGIVLDGELGMYCACPDGRLVYRDVDGDGFGIAGVSVPSCDGSLPSGYVTNGTDCNDADPGIHPGVTDVCNGLDDDCDGTADSAGAALCDDGILCTTDSCVGAAGCAHVNNTAACDDGNACTTNDSCMGGTCLGGPPRACNDGDPCTIDSCSPGSGCVATFSSGACDDGNICTIGETCATGVCTGPPNDGVACNDGSVCTTGDVCLGGSCSPGAVPLDCSDGNVCTTDSCGPITGCTHANNTIACDDGIACTAGDTCAAGACHGAPVVCNDNNPCTDNFCDSATGSCVAANDDTNTCTDGNLCTQVDICQAGLCAGSNPVSCGACPTGFTIVEGLCERTYDIGANALDNQTASCDGNGTNRYNDCNSQSYGFHWTDLGAAFSAVVRVDIHLESGVNCAGVMSSVRLNGAPLGTFHPVGTCSCSTPHGTITFADLDPGIYAKGGLNALSILPTGNCEGLSRSASFGNNYARVTVAYVPHAPCEVGTCAPATGACSYSALPDGAACTDGDLCTFGDACAAGSCAGMANPAPSETTGVVVDKSGDDAVIGWTLAPAAEMSEVLRGDIAALPVGSGAGEFCLGSTGATSMNDSIVLPANFGVWYLIRGVNACAGNGPYGFQGVHGAPGTPRLSSTCP
jgi:hypothetical protein